MLMKNDLWDTKIEVFLRIILLGLFYLYTEKWKNVFVLVGMRRLERPTSTSRTWRATNCATSRNIALQK